MSKCLIVLALFGCFSSFALQGADTESNFRIRDLFVLVEGNDYYLYESKPWSGGDGVMEKNSRL